MIKLGRWFNTDVRLHWTTALLILVASWNAYGAISKYIPRPLPVAIGALVYSFGLLFSVVAHEFGHIIIGRKVGVAFNKITIHGLGGAAHMESNVPSPRSEALMAVAGPVVSLALCVVFGLATWALTSVFPQFVLTGFIFAFIAFSNFALMAFNLLPVFPLDGGRIFRAGVWKLTNNFMKATEISAFIGKLGGVGFITMGLLMMVDIHIPFFGVGIQSGIWQIVMGILIICFADNELKHYRNGHD
jgi:Zn-dependent protease